MMWIFLKIAHSSQRSRYIYIEIEAMSCSTVHIYKYNTSRQLFYIYPIIYIYRQNDMDGRNVYYNPHIDCSVLLNVSSVAWHRRRMSAHISTALQRYTHTLDVQYTQLEHIRTHLVQSFPLRLIPATLYMVCAWICQPRKRRGWTKPLETVCTYVCRDHCCLRKTV